MSELGKIVRPQSPTRTCKISPEDASHIGLILNEKKVNDESGGKLLGMRSNEIVCALSSKTIFLSNTGQVVSNIDLPYYWCNFCTFKSEDKHLLLKHLIEHRFKCQYCIFQTFSRIDIIRHMVKEHNQYDSDNLKFCVLLPDLLKHGMRDLDEASEQQESSSPPVLQSEDSEEKLKSKGGKRKKRGPTEQSPSPKKKKGEEDEEVKKASDQDNTTIVTPGVCFECTICKFRTFQKPVLSAHNNSKHDKPKPSFSIKLVSRSQAKEIEEMDSELSVRIKRCTKTVKMPNARPARRVSPRFRNRETEEESGPSPQVEVNCAQDGDDGDDSDDNDDADDEDYCVDRDGDRDDDDSDDNDQDDVPSSEKKNTPTKQGEHVTLNVEKTGERMERDSSLEAVNKHNFSLPDNTANPSSLHLPSYLVLQTPSDIQKQPVMFQQVPAVAQHSQNTQFGIKQNPQAGVQQNPQFGIQQNQQFGTQQNPQFCLQQNPQFVIEQHPQPGIHQNQQLVLQPNQQLVLQQNPPFVIQQNTQPGIKQHSQFVLQQNPQFEVQQNPIYLVQQNPDSTQDCNSAASAERWTQATPTLLGTSSTATASPGTSSIATASNRSSAVTQSSSSIGNESILALSGTASASISALLSTPATPTTQASMSASASKRGTAPPGHIDKIASAYIMGALKARLSLNKDPNNKIQVLTNLLNSEVQLKAQLSNRTDPKVVFYYNNSVKRIQAITNLLNKELCQVNENTDVDTTHSVDRLPVTVEEFVNETTPKDVPSAHLVPSPISVPAQTISDVPSAHLVPSPISVPAQTISDVPSAHLVPSPISVPAQTISDVPSAHLSSICVPAATTSQASKARKFTKGDSLQSADRSPSGVSTASMSYQTKPSSNPLLVQMLFSHDAAYLKRSQSGVFSTSHKDFQENATDDVIIMDERVENSETYLNPPATTSAGIADIVHLPSTWSQTKTVEGNQQDDVIIMETIDENCETPPPAATSRTSTMSAATSRSSATSAVGAAIPARSWTLTVEGEGHAEDEVIVVEATEERSETTPPTSPASTTSTSPAERIQSKWSWTRTTEREEDVQEDVIVMGAIQEKTPSYSPGKSSTASENTSSVEAMHSTWSWTEPVEENSEDDVIIMEDNCVPSTAYHNSPASTSTSVNTSVNTATTEDRQWTWSQKEWTSLKDLQSTAQIDRQTREDLHMHNQELTEDLTRSRRTANNTRERRRIRNMNEAFDLLTHMVLPRQEQSQPPTKTMVLQKAINIITCLDRQIRDPNYVPPPDDQMGREVEKSYDKPAGIDPQPVAAGGHVLQTVEGEEDIVNLHVNNGTTKEEQERLRREANSTRERKRLAEMNTRFNQLGLMVARYCKGRPLNSKLTVLQEAINVVAYLRVMKEKRQEVDRVSGQVGGQVRGQVGGQVRGQAGGQVGGQVGELWDR